MPGAGREYASAMPLLLLLKSLSNVMLSGQIKIVFMSSKMGEVPRPKKITG
jgi:hypothetical protein